MEPTEFLILAFENFSCDDTQLYRLVKDTIRALDKDLEEGDYAPSKIAEKTYEELEEYLEELKAFESDDDDDDDDNEEQYRDIDEDDVI